MKPWKTSALVTVALIWGTSVVAAPPIRASQSIGVKPSPASALSLAPRAGMKLQRGNRLDDGGWGPLTIGLTIAAAVGAYFFYTEVIDDDKDNPASP